ncbi:MAG: iron ABC transporter permease [Geminocystis sp.]|nr:iron ABC transporter permease [Geminocystis sp.]MCS7148277.1 iron ABC transporter permease [Geminocystis sp.]MCX8077692.1 iron ABC transporter permease [Geminocystis sp.]MDW8116584.1 iron ABC transporter permease [Geminocystis sp.]HIK37320.1 iron ABC transporter permease [Geminocystis sp. M7585_C2015_104]
MISILKSRKTLNWAGILVYLWNLSLGLVALAIALPVLAVASSILADKREVWQHLTETVLKDYILNTLWLMLGVGIGVTVIGVGCAWLVTMCDFWGVNWWQWLLLMPLAAPAYLLAYSYTDMLEYYGPIQTWLRAIFGWESARDYWFPSIRNLGGAIVMLTLVLYPYVYMLARVAFLEQSVCSIEASRSLGCNPWKSFFSVALPLARPSIVAGLALALMETLNDFGTVQYFGVDTFTTGIYRTWINMRERVAAAQLAFCLMVFVLILIVLERISRLQARYYQMGGVIKAYSRYHLNWWRGSLAFIACALPVALGFFIPLVYLIYLTITWEETWSENFWFIAQNSLFLALVTGFVAVVLSLIMAYGKRLFANPFINTSTLIASMGYAIPGSVIAVGILIPLGAVDNAISDWLEENFNVSVGLIFSGTVIALIYGYLVRFFAVSLNTVESSLSKIKPHLDEASRSLGHNPLATLLKIHLPLMRGGVLTAFLLVFVDVMKELPATLVLRPFNFDTLAVRVFQYASDERLADAAAPAIVIILVGLIPVCFLSYRIAKGREDYQQL